MKAFLKTCAGSLLILTPSTLWAVQGNLQSSSGYVASSMGGATVAQFSNEFDAVIDNPAMMQFSKTSPGTHKFSLGLEYAKYPNSFAIGDQDYEKGKLDSAYIPFVGYFYNFSDDIKFGSGLFALGGTGYNYEDSAPKTSSEYAAVTIPLAISFKISDQLNFGTSVNLVGAQAKFNNFGEKNTKANAFTATPSFGLSFDPGPFVIGADFILGTTATFSKLGFDITDNSEYNIRVGTPSQLSLGLGRNYETFSYGFKYRYVVWEHTENYKQLGWKNQHTFSLGGQYSVCEEWIARAGLYYVSSVYPKTEGVDGDQMVTYQGHSTPKALIEFSNAMGYGMPQWQYALGAGYKMNQKSIIDFGILYEAEKELNFSGSFSTNASNTYKWRKKNSNLQIFLTYSQEV